MQRQRQNSGSIDGMVGVLMVQMLQLSVKRRPEGYLKSADIRFRKKHG